MCKNKDKGRKKRHWPFVGCDRVDEDVTVDVDGVTLREDGVLILHPEGGLDRKSTVTVWFFSQFIYCKTSRKREHMCRCGINSWVDTGTVTHLSGRVDQLQVVLLTVHSHRLGERWEKQRGRLVKPKAELTSVKAQRQETNGHSLFSMVGS